jgi:hypothetical protein
MSIATKKKKIIAYIEKNLKPLDPEGKNILRYKKMLGAMSDKAFDQFMINMRDKEFQFHIIIPNMGPKSTMDDILKAAEMVNLKLFHRIWFTDEATGKKFLSRAEYPILQLPIRRMQQFLDKKMSVPDSDQSIDGLTGQVTGSDRSASITNPEIQALHSKGLSHTLNEMVTVRGGDIASYGEMRRQMEEGGEANLGAIEVNSVTRTAVVTKVLLEGMLLDNNVVEGV